MTIADRSLSAALLRHAGHREPAPVYRPRIVWRGRARNWWEPRWQWWVDEYRSGVLVHGPRWSRTRSGGLRKAGRVIDARERADGTR